MPPWMMRCVGIREELARLAAQVAGLTTQMATTATTMNAHAADNKRHTGNRHEGTPMIDPHCSPEVEATIAYGTSTGVPMTVTSTLRPGAITISGNRSFHGLGLAVDWAGHHPTIDSDVLADIFHAFLPVEKHLAELIYAGPQVGFNIKNGIRVGKYAQSIHHNHVHVAVQKGVLLDRLIPSFLPDTIIEQAPQDHEGEDMADPVDAMCAPGGGVWVVTRDGGVRAYGGAPYYGSYPGLPAEQRLATDPFVDIGLRDDGAPGYMLRNSGGALYRFGP